MKAVSLPQLDIFHLRPLTKPKQFVFYQNSKYLNAYKDHKNVYILCKHIAQKVYLNILTDERFTVMHKYPIT